MKNCNRKGNTGEACRRIGGRRCVTYNQFGQSDGWNEEQAEVALGQVRDGRKPFEGCLKEGEIVTRLESG